jgi:hypothetical protein
MTTTEEINQAYARLMAHEFALECITATVLNCMPLAEAEGWLAGFKEKSRQVLVQGDAAVDDIRATTIVRDGLQLTDHFAEKVRARLRRE